MLNYTTIDPYNASLLNSFNSTSRALIRNIIFSEQSTRLLYDKDILVSSWIDGAVAVAQWAIRRRVVKATALWADAFYNLKCLSVCLFIFEVPLKRLFAPTS